MSVKPEIKAIVKLEIAASRPKTWREAMRVVGRVMNTYSNIHCDIFDKRRNCAKFCKASVVAL